MGMVDRFGTSTDVELTEDVGDVGAGGVTGDEELVGNRLIRPSGAEQPQHVLFALRQAGCLYRSEQHCVESLAESVYPRQRWRGT